MTMALTVWRIGANSSSPRALTPPPITTIFGLAAQQSDALALDIVYNAARLIGVGVASLVHCKQYRAPVHPTAALPARQSFHRLDPTDHRPGCASTTARRVPAARGPAGPLPAPMPCPARSRAGRCR